MASKYDGQLLWTLEKERQRKNGPPLSRSGPSPYHLAGWVNHKASSSVKHEPRSSSLSFPKRLCKTKAGRGPYVHLLCQECSSTEVVVCPVEEGQGCPDFILTCLHACGDLSATLLLHFASSPHVHGITSVACCYMKITTGYNPNPPGLIARPLSPLPTNETYHSEFGYPMSSSVQGLPGHQLSYKAREGVCHAIEDYVHRLREESGLLRMHCYRATLKTVIREVKPGLRGPGVQAIKKAHLLPFTGYARLGLPLDTCRVGAMLRQESRVVVYFSLTLLLAPVV